MRVGTCQSPCPVQLRPSLTLMMEQPQRAHGVLGFKPHQTLTCQGRMWMILTWTQPLETVSHVQAQMKCPYELPARGTRRGYGLPVDWAKAVSGQRLNWKGSVRITRTFGDTTMNVLEQSRNMLLQKTTTPSRCKNDDQDWSTAPHCWGH